MSLLLVFKKFSCVYTGVYEVAVMGWKKVVLIILVPINKYWACLTESVRLSRSGVSLIPNFSHGIFDVQRPQQLNKNKFNLKLRGPGVADPCSSETTSIAAASCRSSKDCSIIFYSVNGFILRYLLDSFPFLSHRVSIRFEIYYNDEVIAWNILIISLYVL